MKQSQGAILASGGTGKPRERFPKGWLRDQLRLSRQAVKEWPNWMRKTVGLPAINRGGPKAGRRAAPKR